MTRVNVLLPLFQTSLRTNNSQVISEILTQKYGIVPAEIFWLDSRGQADDPFECVIRLQNLALTFEGAVEEVERRKAVQETLKRLQVDIFNVVKKHEELFQDRKYVIPLQRLRDEMGNEVEDSEVSLKIEEKPKNKEGVAHSEQQMMIAIGELTRENLKLKDAIIFYEAQLQLMKGGVDPLPLVGKHK